MRSRRPSPAAAWRSAARASLSQADPALEPGGGGAAVEGEEALVHAVDEHALGAAAVVGVARRSGEGEERRRGPEGIPEARLAFERGGEAVAKGGRRLHGEGRPAETLESEAGEAAPHRLAHQQGAREGGHGGGHPQHHRHVGAPEVGEAAPAEGGEAHRSPQATGSRRRPTRRRRSAKRAARSLLWVTRTRMVCSRRVQLEEQVGHGRGRGPVEVAGRLVAEQETRPQDEGARQGRPLSFPAGELGRTVVEALAEAHPREQLPRASLEVGGRGTPSPRGDQRRHEDVLQHRALRQQVVLLEDEADLAVAKGGEVGLGQREGVAPEERDLTRGGRLERAQDVEERALPAPRGPHDAERLAGSEAEVHALEDRQGAAGRVVALGDGLHLEQRRSPFRPSRAGAPGARPHR